MRTSTSTIPVSVTATASPMARSARSPPPAVDAGRQRAYLNFWPAGESASKLIALDYRMQDRERSIHQVWSAAIPGGMIGPPTLSADGSRVYAVSKPGTLLAVDTTTGKTVWTHNLGEHGFATLAVSPGGLIIPTGSVGAPLTLLRDTGSAAEQVWQRTDLAVVSLSTLTARNTAWTVVRDAGKDSLSLTEVSTADGKTLRTIAMPGSKGFATGVAVSAAGRSPRPPTSARCTCSIRRATVTDNRTPSF